MGLTIGICAFNEERNIRTILFDVLNQTGLTDNVDVIVVASGCTDKTPSIVREIMKHDHRVRLVEEQSRTGKTGAINLILARCRSDLLALVDADIRLPIGCVSKVLRSFSDEKIGVVGALPVVGNSKNGAIAEAASVIWRVMRQALTELNSRGQLSYVMGEMYCFRTRLVGKIPQEIVNDDAYVASLAQSRGSKVVFAPGANFVTKVPSSVREYVAQRRRVTFGHLQIKARTGKYATSMEGIALDHTWTLVHAMVGEATSHLVSIVRALLLLELEVVSTLLAWIDRMTGKQHVIY